MTSILSTYEGSISRWTRVGELGTEAGLRELGCSERKISKALEVVGAKKFDFYAFRDVLHEFEEHERAVLLATIGRGISCDLWRLDLRSDFPVTSNEINALCVNLNSNSNVVELDLCYNRTFSRAEGYIPLAAALRNNSSIKELKMSDCGIGETEAVRCILDGLKTNETLATLDLSHNELLDGATQALAEFLSTNQTLKSLNVFRGYANHDWSTAPSLIAPEGNTPSKDLHVGNDSSIGDHPLTSQFSSGPKNTALLSLDFGMLRAADRRTILSLFDSIAVMIRTNNNLSTLRITDMDLPIELWKRLSPALKENETLEELDLKYSRFQEDVFNDLMRILQFSSARLRKINLQGTKMGSRQAQVDQEMKVNEHYRGQLRGQTRVPTTAGRLILCGYEFSGKTAILKTMECIEQGNSWKHTLKVAWKKLMKDSPGLRSFLFGKDAHRELTKRTRGFDILALHNQRCLRSVWDFAGQKEYYALHDHLFPNVVNSCFLYVCSSRCPPDIQNPQGKIKDIDSMRDECEYWMRFIASNSKTRHCQGNALYQLPQVRFVLTHKDTLDEETLTFSKQRADKVVDELRKKFKDVIGIYYLVEVVNAHSLTDVKRLMRLTSETLGIILEHQTEYAVCEAVRNAMGTWSVENRSKPVLGLAEFQDICARKVGPSALVPYRDAHLHSSEGREAVLAYLNDAGDLIFPKGLDFVVANPRWFGLGVLGSLIDAFGEVEALNQTEASLCSGVLVRRPKQLYKLLHKEGFVKREHVSGLLNHSLQTMNLKQLIQSDKLVQLMIQLELCFEEQFGREDSSLFIPAVFDDETETAAKGRRKLEWKLERSGDLYYLGRRLECENTALTFLTPGFFPRLQVHLRNYIHEKEWTDNPGFSVQRNLICFAENGVEVCIEYSGDIGYFVDILVRSSKPYAIALQFIEEHVVRKICQFCASPQGCQGVTLVEAVIRPECVQNLYVCAERKAQSIRVSDLRAHLAEDEDYEHTWRTKIEDVQDTNFCRDLLEGEGAHKMALAKEETLFFAPEISGITATASSHLEELLSNAERQFPKLFYPSIEDVGFLRKLDQWLNVAKVIPIKLHLMCDHKDGSHKVKDQPGRAMKLKLKADSWDLPLAKLALQLLWAGVGAATASAGVRVSLPMVDQWVESLFKVRGMPDISVDTLHQLMDRGGAPMPISDKEIVKALDRYWKAEPYTEGLKSIVNLQDSDSFWEDFLLRKVVYTEPLHRGKVGWLCEKHYQSGFKKGIVQRVFLG